MEHSDDKIFAEFMDTLYTLAVSSVPSVLKAVVHAQASRNVTSYQEPKEWLDGLSNEDRKIFDFLLRLGAGMSVVSVLTLVDGMSGVIHAGNMVGDAELKLSLWNNIDDVSETPPDRTVTVSSGTEITDASLRFHNMVYKKLSELPEELE